MNRIQPKDSALIDLFNKRDGLETKVKLKDGKIISVWNIAWGYDIGDEYAHITTNISPSVIDSTIDFFFTYDIVSVINVDD